jgi:hypothetical protein
LGHIINNFLIHLNVHYVIFDVFTVVNMVNIDVSEDDSRRDSMLLVNVYESKHHLSPEEQSHYLELELV